MISTLQIKQEKNSIIRERERERKSLNMELKSPKD